MNETKFGISLPSPIDFSSTPAQENHQPHADDPFCGNENNRRAHERRIARDKAAQGEAEATQKPLIPAQTSRSGRRGAAAPTWTPNA